MRKLPIFTLLIPFLLFTNPVVFTPITDARLVEKDNAQVAHQWFNMFRILTKKTWGFTPPVAARAFGYAGLTLYESVVSGMPDHQSLQTQLSAGLKIPPPEKSLNYDWQIAANAAMAEVAKRYYPFAPQPQLLAANRLEEATEKRLIEENDVDFETVKRSKNYGKSVALIIFDWSKTDGGHEAFKANFPKNFVPPVGEGLWSAAYESQKPMLPNWGKNRTFLREIVEKTQPNTPFSYSEDKKSPFYQAAVEVYLTSKSLTSEQKTIAKYWSDDLGEAGGTPPFHAISITTEALKIKESNLAEAAETYAKVGIALSDAFVSCWFCKYKYNCIRPINYIQKQIEPSFKSLIRTPPFPEFPSGHSVQSGAAATVLTAIFGENFAFSDRTHEDRLDINGTARHYKSFHEFAKEASISRLYGGIHFREAIESGLEQGNKVGAEINKLVFKKTR
jgi:hypothetical protein